MVTQLFALVLGLGISYAGYSYSALARRMRSYKSVPGTVVSREVTTAPGGDTTTGHWGEGGGYTPRVTYTYVVDGTEFRANQLARGVRGYKRAIAERKLGEIPDQVTVWYDPTQPSDAYLHKHGTGFGYAILALGVCLTLGALISFSI